MYHDLLIPWGMVIIPMACDDAHGMGPAGQVLMHRFYGVPSLKKVPSG